ncbi:MAG: hypothetical protein CMJ46_01575 [Planctomyces sp.]|nr:hypothetical protein [Planctomyces sp.]
MKPFIKNLSAAAIAVPMLFAAGPVLLSGCDDDREIMEVETPEGETEIEQDPDTGAIEVETEN